MSEGFFGTVGSHHPRWNALSKRMPPTLVIAITEKLLQANAIQIIVSFLTFKFCLHLKFSSSSLRYKYSLVCYVRGVENISFMNENWNNYIIFYLILNRYLAVTQPLNYSRRRRSKRLAMLMILIVWILALAITCPPILGTLHFCSTFPKHMKTLYI